MTENAFSNVAIVGAGTMGHGIAQVCAMAGMEVRMYDVADAALQRGLDAVHANLDKGVDRLQHPGAGDEGAEDGERERRDDQGQVPDPQHASTLLDHH